MYVPLNLWNQSGANPAGSGYRLVDTTAATAPGWAADLPGPTGTSSPVLGPDGTIYIGTGNCWLVALYPDYQRAGQVKWSTQLLAGVRPDSTFYDVQRRPWPMTAQFIVFAPTRPSCASMRTAAGTTELSGQDKR
jgi:outer membrane protein assembly factor BamB